MEGPEGALISAAGRCDAQSMETILNGVSDIDVNYADRSGMTPLMLSVSAKRAKANQQLQCVRMLLERDVYLDSADAQHGRTAAHWAVACRNAPLLAEILAAGADVTRLDGQQLSVVHLAVECSAAQCIGAIAACLQHAGVMDELDGDGLTPLVRATRHGNAAVAKQLLASGASPSLATAAEEQRNAVHWAAVCGQAKILAMMLKAGGDVRSVDSNQWTVAHLAAVHASTACLEVLLKSASELVFEVADHDGLTPLMVACQADHAPHVKLMLRKKVSVLVADNLGWTALHHCVLAPNVKCVSLLTKHEPKLLERADAEGKTPLQLAVLEGSGHVADALLRCGADVSVVGGGDGEASSLAHWATVQGHAPVLQTLANHGASVSLADGSGVYPLHYAAQLSATLPSHPGDESHEPGQGLRMQECLRMLLQLGAPVDVADLDGQRPLHWAAGRPGNTTAMEMLVRSGAGVDVCDHQRLTALHVAARYGVMDACRLLLSRLGAAVNAVDANGRTPLFYAVVNSHHDIAELMIDGGAELEHLDDEGMSVAHCAAAVGLIDFLEMLQSEAPRLLSRPSEFGKTPLHEAAVTGQTVCLEYLVSAGCAVRCRMDDGITPLHLSAEASHYECTALLLEARALVNSLAITEDVQFLTPLDCALLHDADDACHDVILAHGGCAADDLVVPAAITIQRYGRGLLARRQRHRRTADAPTLGEASPPLSDAEDDRLSSQAAAPAAEKTADGSVTGSEAGEHSPVAPEQAKLTTPTSAFSDSDSDGGEVKSSGGSIPSSSDDLSTDRPDSVTMKELHQENTTPVSASMPAKIPEKAATAAKAEADVHRDHSMPAVPSALAGDKEAHADQQQRTSGLPAWQPGEVHEELVFSVIPRYEDDDGDKVVGATARETSGELQQHAIGGEEPQNDTANCAADVSGDPSSALGPPAHTDTGPAIADLADSAPSESVDQEQAESPGKHSQSLTARQRVHSFLSRTSSIINPLNQYLSGRRRASLASAAPADVPSRPSSIAFLCAHATAVAGCIAGEAVGTAALHVSQAIAVGTLEELLERRRRDTLDELAEEQGGGSADTSDISASSTERSDGAGGEQDEVDARLLKPVASSARGGAPPDASPSAEDVMRALEASRGPTLAAQATQELVKTLNLQIKLQQELVEAELESEKHILAKTEEVNRQRIEEEVLKERSMVNASLGRANTVAEQISADMLTTVHGAQRKNDLLHRQLGAVGCPRRPTVAQWLQSKEKSRRAKAQQDLLAWDMQRGQREVMLAAEKLLREERKQRHHGWEKIKSLQMEVRREEKHMQDLKHSQSPEALFASQMVRSEHSLSRHSSITAAGHSRRAGSRNTATSRHRRRSDSAPGSQLPSIPMQRQVTPRRQGPPQAAKREATMTTSGFVKLPAPPAVDGSLNVRSPRRYQKREEQYGAEDLWELASEVATGRAEAPAVVDGRSLYPKKPATRRTGRRTLAFLPPDEYDVLQRERQQKERVLGMRTGAQPPSSRQAATTRAPSRFVSQRRRGDGIVTVMSRALVDTESEISV